MVAPGFNTLRTTVVAGLLALAAGAPGCRPSTTAATEPGPDLVATGSCLGRLCLGMTETAALAAIDAAAVPASAGGRHCFRLEDADLELSFEVDTADARRTIRAILVTNLAHCSPGEDGAPAATGGAMPVGGAGRIADCRGLRPGDPESFATKLHRHASPIAAPADPWSGAPAGVHGFEDVCEPAAADTTRAGLYLRDGRVVGLAVWRP
jgi:hypothetical protein